MCVCIVDSMRLLCTQRKSSYNEFIIYRDEVLYSIADVVKNFAVIYLVDITQVPDFNKVAVFC